MPHTKEKHELQDFIIQRLIEWSKELHDDDHNEDDDDVNDKIIIIATTIKIIIIKNL